MITVSDEFKAIWEDKQGQAVQQRLRYKRRYKIGAAYFTEAEFRVLDKPDFMSIGNIPQQGDVRGNIIKSSVVTLKVPNENNQWIEHAGSPSFYAADDVAVNGYKAARTIWQVQEGFKLASGDIEWISVFTGIQLRQPKITGKGSSAAIEVASKAILLEKADAEEVSEEPGLENCIPAVGNGVLTVFESTSTGVDHAKLFEVNGVNKTQGSEWRVANENEIASAGNTGRLAITASVAPPAAQTVKTSVKRWLRTQRLETLEGLLADEAGIPSTDRVIIPSIFPGGLSGSKTIDVQADWAAGVLAAVSSDAVPGSIRSRWSKLDDFADGDLTDNPTWTVIVASPTVAVVANALKLESTGAGISFAAVTCPGTMKTWVFDADGVAPPGKRNVVTFVDTLAGGAICELELPASDGTARINTPVGGAGLGAMPVGSHTWRVTRSDAGVFNVYLDTVLVGTVTDATPLVGGYFSAKANSAGGAGATTCTLILDNIWVGLDVSAAETPTLTGTWTSATQDLLSAPSAWGQIVKMETLNGGTTLYETSSSVDDIIYDAFVAISATGIIQSALKRYLKVRVTMTALPYVFTSPVVDSIVVNFSTTDVFVSLANHRGRTVMQQMELYVKIPDYELRFRGDGSLMIAPKTPGTHVVHLTQENAIIDVTEVDYGIPDRVVRAGRVRYQGFTSFFGDVEAGASAETIADGDELGKKVLDEDLDEILVANDINLGASRARVVYENNRRSATDPRPPVRIRMKVWDVPWLEVSDVVRVSYYDHPLLSVFQANDELLRADSPYFHMGDPGNVISKAKDWRVLYYNPNKDTGISDILAEEVL